MIWGNFEQYSDSLTSTCSLAASDRRESTGIGESETNFRQNRAKTAANQER